MYLKRLELRGFKTFATYTDLVFDEGITAVVGPNGSGKSNIADAVRWVLGEQSYLALRGKRTEDMVFSGTRRRPPLGMAEATLTFDNESRWLPIDFAEVTVSRRAYRSSENQYLINGSRVRLRDVVELLGQAGLGRQGFVTIGQGVVDAALSLRPEERRALFEEAAGIRVYQDKRLEALAKLAETQQNLTRLSDILHEIAPRLHDLEKQAQRAGEHDLLRRDLEKLLRLWYGFRWRRLQDDLEAADTAVAHRMEDVELARARMHEVEALVANTQFHLAELRRQLSLWHAQSGELHAEAEGLGRQLAVGRERSSLLAQRQAELRNELALLSERRSGLQQTLAAAKEEQNRLHETLNQHRLSLDELRKRWQQAESTRGDAERQVDAQRELAYRQASALAEARNLNKQLQERQRQVQSERDRARAELQTVEDRLPSMQTQLATLAQKAEQARADRQRAQDQQAELQVQVQALDEDWRRRREALAQAQQQTQRLEDRLEMLTGLRESSAGYAPGVKAVLEARTALPGIIGSVAELIHVPEKLERAIEAALGSYAQALVTDTWDDAGKAIAHLRDSRSGWATFLPLDSLHPAKRHGAPAGKAILGLAQDLVQYDARFEPVAELLLGRIVVVEDLDTARRVRPSLVGGQRAVTLSGEVVQPTGVLSGGAGRRQGGLLAQEREWRALPDLLKAAKESEAAAKDALATAEAQQQETRRNVTRTGQEIVRLTAAMDASGRERDKLTNQIQQLGREAEWRKQLEAQQQRELDELSERAVEVAQRCEHQQQDGAQHKEALETALATLERARGAEEAARQALAEAETGLAVSQRQAQMQDQAFAGQQATVERLEQEYHSKSERVGEIDQEHATLTQQLQTLQTRTDSLSATIAALAEQIKPSEDEVVALDRQATALESNLAQARQRLTEVETRHGQQVLEKQRRHDALEALEQRIEEELGDIDYPSEQVRQLRLDLFRRERTELPDTEVLPDTMQGDIRDLKARLRRLGSINPNAVQEHQQVRERYDFMQSQMQDLTASTANLQNVVRELDTVMEREFLAVFEVAQREFERYFETLFNGGQAKLILTEPESPATTGVDIFARPPGKRPQTLALLSGGERALTATALLFAVLKARPLPFCVLDEVDAMLDEANVGRFRSLLEEASQQTQFIVITHNRRTIEAARTIYGVSMAEEGVSKIVSLRLEQTEARSRT